MNGIDWKTAWRNPPRTTRRRPWLAAGTGIIAVNALAAAAGLLFGGLDFGTAIDADLPWRSKPLAGLALAVVVGLPMTTTTVLAAKGSRWTAMAATLSGALLLGWIVVQLGFLGPVSWMQPVTAFAGLAVMVAGLRDFPRIPRAMRRS